MSPPRNITYNGITVRKPSAVIWDGRRYQIHFLPGDNDIALDIHTLSDYCMIHLNNFYSFVDFNSIKFIVFKMEKYHHAERVILTRQSFGWDPMDPKAHVDLCQQFLGVFHPIVASSSAGGFFLSVCFCLHDSYLGRMSFDREFNT